MEGSFEVTKVIFFSKLSIMHYINLAKFLEKTLFEIIFKKSFENFEDSIHFVINF